MNLLNQFKEYDFFNLFNLLNQFKEYDLFNLLDLLKLFYALFYALRYGGAGAGAPPAIFLHIFEYSCITWSHSRCGTPLARDTQPLVRDTQPLPGTLSRSPGTLSRAPWKLCRVAPPGSLKSIPAVSVKLQDFSISFSLSSSLSIYLSVHLIHPHLSSIRLIPPPVPVLSPPPPLSSSSIYVIISCRSVMSMCHVIMSYI